MGLIKGMKRLFSRREDGGNGRRAGRLARPNADSGLLAGELDATPYQGLWHLPYPGQEVMGIASGTAGRTMRHYAELLHIQDLQTASLAAMLCAFTTQEDLASLKGCPVAAPVIQSRQKGWSTCGVKLPNRGILLPKRVRTLDNHNGSGSDPAFAVHVLQTDSLAVDDLRDLVDASVKVIKENNLTGCNLLKIVGAGGSYPYGDLMEVLFRRQVRVNRRHELLLAPSPWQTANVRIARAWLAHRLSKPSPDDTLLYLVQLEGPGEQDWDAALAAGLLTVTGTDSLYGQPDASSLFARLREQGDIVVVKPRVICLPLRPSFEANLFRRRDHQPLFDAALPAILREMKWLVEEEDEDAFHLFAVGGRFTGDEVRQLRRHVQMLHRPGRIEALVNHLLPATRNGAAEFLLTDLVVPKGQPKPLMDLASLGDERPLRYSADGAAREELVERLGSADSADKVDAAVRRIAELQGR